MSNYKKGDLVRVLDGSYSLALENGDFRHSYGIELTDRDFEVLHTDLKLPSTDFDQFNTMVIKAKNNGQIVYTQERMVKSKLTQDKDFTFNINVTIQNPKDIDEIIKELKKKIKIVAYQM